MEVEAKNPEDIPRILALAMEHGLVVEGWCMEDYLVNAYTKGLYETVLIWGVQGSGKSSRMLQMGYWIYKDWEKVLNSIVFQPIEFVKRLQAIPEGKIIPCLLWDDVGVHYPSSTFKTDIKQYEAIDSTWAAIRTKCSVIILTIPLIDRLAKNIKDNITYEVFIGNNQMERIQRIIRLPGLRNEESNCFKILIERPQRFNLYEVPKPIFERYWERRLQLTEEALQRLHQTVNETDFTGYITVLQASEETGISANTIQQMESRGVLRGKKINGTLCLTKESYDQFVDVMSKNTKKGKEILYRKYLAKQELDKEKGS